MDARGHYARAEALMQEGLDSGNWSVRSVMAQEAAVHAQLAALSFTAEQAGITDIGGPVEEPVPDPGGV
jgi:hypothetical protein